MRWSLVMLGGVTVLALLLAACSPASAPDLPRWLRGAPPEVRDAYAFAVAHPEVLQYIPCYCGCEGVGHRSNRDCFVREMRADGTVAYDLHGAG